MPWGPDAGGVPLDQAVGSEYLFTGNLNVGSIQNLAASGGFPSPREPVWSVGGLAPIGAFARLLYGAGTFVAIGSASGSSTLGVVSKDYGKTWLPTTMPSAQWKRLEFGNNRWLAVSGNDSTQNIGAVSWDGIVWTATTLPVTAYWYTSGFGNGTFVIVRYADSTGHRSIDGINWASFAIGVARNWRDIAYGNGVWVLVSDDSNSVRVSQDDGATWAAGGSTGAAGGLFMVSFLNGFFYVFAQAGTALYRSRDGGVWSAVGWPATIVGDIGSHILVIGDAMLTQSSGGRRPMISNDGVFWRQSSQQMPSTGYILAAGGGALAGIKPQTVSTVQGFVPLITPAVSR